MINDEDDNEIYSTECEMCGKIGADILIDGCYFCSDCLGADGE